MKHCNRSDGDFNPKLIVQKQRYKKQFGNLQYVAGESSVGIPLKGMQYTCIKIEKRKLGMQNEQVLGAWS